VHPQGEKSTFSGLNLGVGEFVRFTARKREFNFFVGEGAGLLIWGIQSNILNKRTMITKNVLTI